jgi:hypothetical protein
VKLTNANSSDPATGNSKLAEGITDKKGYGERWGFSPRHVSNLLAQGLPHLAVGARRVRIIVAEADAWMVERFATRRRGPARVPASVPEASKESAA